jgi:hypothetical protein
VPAAPTPPSIARLAQSHRSWREGKQLARISSNVPVGTAFSLTLNEPAKVRLTFTQAQGGRRVGASCLAPDASNRHRSPCTRMVLEGALSFTAHAGFDKVLFQGRISRSKWLPRGAYVLSATATNASQQRSGAKRLSFSIVK